ncbi:MAG: hypothetical protein K2X87_03810 [Gemmataceae bacterium]|nr:hypothetical protein [Gemmataceae bacterium]
MTSGLVVALDPAGGDGVPGAVGAVPAFTVGEATAGWLSVALEAADAAGSEWWADWLRRLPGVAGVEVVFVHWDGADPEVTRADA